MEEFIREAIREARENDIALNQRVHALEMEQHLMRENEISRRVARLEEALTTIKASYNTTRTIGALIVAILGIMVSLQGNWSCNGPIRKASPAAISQQAPAIRKEK